MVLIDVPESYDKFFGSFFIASRPGHHFITRWRDLFVRYLSPLPPRMSGTQVKRLLKRIPPARPKLGRVLLVTPPVRKKFGSPYFALHYLGTWLLMSSPRALWAWLARPRTRSGKYSSLVKKTNGAAVFREKLESQEFGLWKLTHKVQDDQRELFRRVLREAEDFIDQYPTTP